MGNFITCQVYPYGQDWQFPLNGGGDVCEGFDPKDTTCATDLNELYCLIQHAQENGCDNVQVCDKARIFFGTGQGGGARRKLLGAPFEAGYTLQLPDKMKIECAGCDCTFERPFENVIYTLCPYFTTQLDNNIYLKGFEYESGEFGANHNIISYSNHNPGASRDPIFMDEKYKSLEGGPTTIQTSSDRKDPKCKSSSKSKSAKGCKPSSSSSSSDEPERRGLRFLQDDVADPASPFCGDDFFEDDDELAGNADAGLAIIEDEAMVQTNSDPCSAENNNLVSLFHANDADTDGSLTCKEAENGFINAGYAVPNCAAFFTSISNQKLCFEFNATDETLVLSAV